MLAERLRPPRGLFPPSPSRAQATSWESGQSSVLFFFRLLLATWHCMYIIDGTIHVEYFTPATSAEKPQVASQSFSGRERTIWKHKNQASFSFNENILSQSISDKEDKHLEIQNWQTDIYFWEGKMPILNTLYLRLTYKTNRSWSCYIFWSDQSPANKCMVSQLLIEWTSDWQGHQLSCPRKIKIICICKVFWDKRKIIEERENRLRLKERCQTCAALVPELSNKSTKWKYIKQKYKRQIYFSTQFCTILVVTLHSWYQA